jgi:8-oxo-dGTP diphosphatase
MAGRKEESVSEREPRQVFEAYDRAAAATDGKSEHPRNPYPGVVTLIEDGDRVGGRVLLVHRRARAHRGGFWCLPGGYIEYGEDFLTAGRREVLEETGLVVRIESILSVVSNFFEPRRHTLVIVLLGRVAADSPPPRAGDDADGLEWFPLEGPLPEMAFEADRHIIGRYAATRLAGAPVDARFAG